MCLRMPGYARDLATLEPWEASLARSHARRRRAARGRSSALASVGGWGSLPSLAALIDARREAVRDLSERDPWEISLGRSRARRRAAQLRFVPASSRAKRLSLGALVALTAGPASVLLDSGGGVQVAAAAPAEPEPITTTQHYIVLSAGSEGRQVRLLQRALGLEIDGVYGPQTEAAVRRFQATRGLTVDGIVGAHTSRALAVHAPPALSGAAVIRNLDGEAREPAPGEVSEAASAPPASVLATPTGLDGASASTAAPTTPESPAPTAGEGAGEITGAEGTAAVPATPATPVASVSAEAGETGGAAAAPTPEDPGNYETPAILEGSGGTAGPGEGDETAEAGQGSSEGGTPAEAAHARSEHAAAEAQARAATDAVRHLQASLHVAVDGEFGPETEAAVRRLQAREGLAVDGVAGAATWKALGQHGQPELTPPPSALPQLSHAAGGHRSGGGSQSEQLGGGNVSADQGTRPAGRVGRGEAIRRLQEDLHVSVDGEFGPETQTAVRHFQEAHGLAVDGVVGPDTWSALGIPGAPTLHADPAYFPHSAGSGGGSSSTAGGGSAPGASSSTAEGVVAQVIAAANEIATRPYVYGGGHGSFVSDGYDCSGSVSYALHGGGLLSSPEDSGELESYGEPGPGRYITIYANAEHAWMTIDGRRFDTVALAEDGSRWGGPSDDGGGFVERHPDGL
jgi:peptidoglycan hydrolase-like protein with peptidoglycan-binding domain